MPYTLQKYTTPSSRHTCPSCNKPKRFTRYINTETDEYLADHVGICDRVNNCGYHYTPKQYFQDNPHKKSKNPVDLIRITRPTPPTPSITSYISEADLNNSLNHPQQNHFITYLKTMFSDSMILHLTNMYKIGTHNLNGGGSTIFWQIDSENKIRSGKIIKYDSVTGHRIKNIHTNWIHAVESKYKSSNRFNLKQCLFGEHLLNIDTKSPIAIVESEKTAIITMGHFPQFIWMATGSLHEFKASKLNILKGRRVVAFPDLGAYDRWQEKANELEFNIHISNYLEIHATQSQKEQGLDIGDFL